MATTLQDLKKLSDQQLIANTDKLVQEERRVSLLVLQHLREVEVRRLFVDLGFDSMYKYCVQRLKYSEGETQRRLSAARLLKELPEIEEHIKSGELNITNLSAVQTFLRAEKQAAQPLDREQKLKLLSEVKNKSTREVKANLIEQSHQPTLLAERFQMPQNLPATTLKFETFMNEENQQLLQEFKNLYAHDLDDQSHHSVLLFLLKKAVQHKKKKLGLDKAPAATSNAPLPSAPEVEHSTKTAQNRDKLRIKSNLPPKLRASISPKTQRLIWARANSCCEYVHHPSKTRCTSQYALEIDHILPLAMGGSNEIQNLRLLCRAHNARRAVKTFGSKSL